MIGAFLNLREIHQVFDAAEHILEEHIGTPICMSKCGICCQHTVPPFMTIEAINAVSYLTGMGQLTKMVSIAEGWLLEKHSFATLYEGMPRGWASPKLKEEWASVSGSQCPFLGQDVRCLLYKVRPLTCRSFGVTRDNSDICPRPLGRGESATLRRYIPADMLRDKIASCRKEWEKKNKTWIISGLAPTMLYRVAEPEKFKNLVDSNRIASAKIIGIEHETSLMWQPQVIALRDGMAPDLVAAMR